MTPRTRIILTAVALVPVLGSVTFADFLVYKLGGSGGQQAPGYGPPPGAGGMRGRRGRSGARAAETVQQEAPEGLQIILQGSIKINAGGTMTFTHPSLKESVSFNAWQVQNKDVERRVAATPKEEFRRVLGQAGKDPDAIMKAAVWALKKGLLNEFYAAADKALDLAPGHEAALKVKELKRHIDEPLADNPATEKELRAILPRKTMRTETSKHFLLLTDTEQKPEKGRRKNRAKERLDLLEKVYESFLLLFHAQDVQLDIPTERLKVVLFKEEQDFNEFAKGLNPTLISVAGFWEPISNVSYFYDHGTTEIFKLLEKLQDELNKDAAEAKRNRDVETIQLVKVINMLIDIERENADITVVSHEATHQMAGNTGLLPRHVEIPSWVHEGLATYFEAPGEATWAGIGAVNELRLTYYRALKDDRLHSNIDFIVGDQIFDYARTHGAKLHGYAQAWALTHFMLENHVQEFVQFYRMLGEMPPDVTLNPDLLQELFSRVFGSDHKALDGEWRAYMRNLKTDLERLEDSAKKAK